MITSEDFYIASKDDLEEAAEYFIGWHRQHFGLEGCEDPILIAAEKLLEELEKCK